MQISSQAVHAEYQQGQIGSADPLRIIVLLYEGALQFSRQALEKFDEPAVRGHALGRAHRIVSELFAALDHDKGHEIAANLDALYGFLLDALTRANANGDHKALKDAIEVLQALLPAWRGIESRAKTESSELHG